MKLATLLTSAFLCVAASTSVLGQEAPKPVETSADRPAILQEYDRAIDQVAERAMHSVVEIEVTGFGKPESGDNQDSQTLQRQRSIGSGVIVDPDGYIVTNNHVVAGALRIRVIIAPTTVELVTGHTQLANSQHVYEAKLIGTNRYADLAVVKIEAHDLPTINLPELFQVRLGTDGHCDWSTAGAGSHRHQGNCKRGRQTAGRRSIDGLCTDRCADQSGQQWRPAR